MRNVLMSSSDDIYLGKLMPRKATYQPIPNTRSQAFAKVPKVSPQRPTRGTAAWGALEHLSDVAIDDRPKTLGKHAGRLKHASQ